MSGWMDYWWNEKIDEWISGQLNGLSSGVMSEWMDEQMDETDKSCNFLKNALCFIATAMWVTPEVMCNFMWFSANVTCYKHTCISLTFRHAWSQNKQCSSASSCENAKFTLGPIHDEIVAEV